MAKKNPAARNASKTLQNKAFRAGQKKPRAWKSYVYQEPFKNVGKSMVCCNLSLVRGTQSPECIECTTFGFRLNPAGKRCKSLLFLRRLLVGPQRCPLRLLCRVQNLTFAWKPSKTLVKHGFPHCVSELARKTETKQADVSLGLVGRNKVT